MVFLPGRQFKLSVSIWLELDAAVENSKYDVHSEGDVTGEHDTQQDLAVGPGLGSAGTWGSGSFSSSSRGASDHPSGLLALALLRLLANQSGSLLGCGCGSGCGASVVGHVL